MGVYLSGGGSRAASASMGELRGLRSLGFLDQVSVLSTVSGGSWPGVPFTYLPRDVSDDKFLGGVVPNPEDLTWTHHSGEDPAPALDLLSDHALGSLCTRVGLFEFLAKAAELLDHYRDSPHGRGTSKVHAGGIEQREIRDEIRPPEDHRVEPFAGVAEVGGNRSPERMAIDVNPIRYG